jgi:hypothetical protein
MSLNQRVEEPTLESTGLDGRLTVKSYFRYVIIVVIYSDREASKFFYKFFKYY